MKTNTIVKSVRSTVGKVGFKMRKHSPEILAVTGTIGVIVSGVMACKATTKISGILENTKSQVDDVHEALDTYSPEEYSVEDSKKDLTIIYAKTGVELVKLYAPSVILGTLSLTGLLASNKILRKRNIALAAAYATLDKGFKEYRGRVAERFGTAVENEILHNIKAVEVKETVVDEDGKKKTVKTTIPVSNGMTTSPYSRIFDETNPYYEKNAELNRFFIERVQRMWNDTLISRQGKPVFLNEVYDSLGFDRTQAGQVVGWVYDPANPDIDSYINFGIQDIYTCTNAEAERKVAFLNGYERSIIIDFNVDGNVWELMK